MARCTWRAAISPISPSHCSASRRCSAFRRRLLLTFALSLLLERAFLTPLYSPTTERKGDYGVLITFGISILLRNLALIVCGPYPLRPPSFWRGSLIIATWR